MGERSLCGTHPRHPAAGSDFCKGLLPLPPDAPRQRTQLRDERRSWQLSLTCRERKRGDCRIELVKRNNGKKYTRGGNAMCAVWTPVCHEDGPDGRRRLRPGGTGERRRHEYSVYDSAATDEPPTQRRSSGAQPGLPRTLTTERRPRGKLSLPREHGNIGVGKAGRQAIWMPAQHKAILRSAPSNDGGEG